MTAILRKIRDSSAVWLIGSVGYSLIEILWRGFTHWTMAATGGLCFLLLYQLELHSSQGGILKRGLCGTAIITAVEFAVGCIVNLRLHWQVWDYSKRFGNLLGQICPLYSFFWFLLCILMAPLLRGVRRFLNKI